MRDVSSPPTDWTSRVSQRVGSSAIATARKSGAGLVGGGRAIRRVGCSGRGMLEGRVVQHGIWDLNECMVLVDEPYGSSWFPELEEGDQLDSTLSARNVPPVSPSSPFPSREPAPLLLPFHPPALHLVRCHSSRWGNRRVRALEGSRRAWTGVCSSCEGYRASFFVGLRTLLYGAGGFPALM